MSILCRMGHHRPSRRSQLDLRDQQVKTYCKRCGVILVKAGEKWIGPEESAKVA